MKFHSKSFINLSFIMLPLVAALFTNNKPSVVLGESEEVSYNFNFLNTNMSTNGGEINLTSDNKTITWKYEASNSLSISESGALTISNTPTWSVSSDIFNMSGTITYVSVDATIGGYGTFYLSLGEQKVSKTNKEKLELSELNATSGTIKISFDGANKYMTINSIALTIIDKESETTPLLSWGYIPSTSMKIGETQTLEITKNEAASKGNITIASSDTSVISVDNFNITALKEGSSNIIVSSDIEGCNSLSIDIFVSLTVKYLSSSGSGDYLKVTNMSNLLDGDKFIIVNEEKSRYALNYIVSNGSLDQSSGITITNGVIKASDIYDNKLLLTLIKSSTGYLLKSENSGYLNISEGKFSLNNDSSTLWNISIDEGIATIKNETNQIVYGDNCFKLSSNASNIAIYRLDSTSIKEVIVSTSLKEAIEKINENYLTCDVEGLNSKIEWTNIKATTMALDESDRNILTNLIIPTSGVINVIEAFVSRYDYIISKYNYEDFLSRYSSSTSNSLSLINDDNLIKKNIMIIVIITLCSASLLMGISILKKERK